MNIRQRSIAFACLLALLTGVADLRLARGDALGEAERMVSKAVSLYAAGGGPSDVVQARDLFLKAAATGSALGIMWVARNYSMGRVGFPENRGKADALAERVIAAVEILALLGNAGALFLMASALDEGLAVPKDSKRAVDMYLKAANAGHVLAQNRLGTMYRTGRGVKPNNEKAVEWYRKAAAQGHASAQHSLSWMNKKGRGEKQGNNEAGRWHAKAAELTPGREFRDCETCPEMVVVPRGRFWMGSPDGDNGERPRRGVSIGSDLAVGKYEVTVAQFRRFVWETGRDMSSGCIPSSAGVHMMLDWYLALSWESPGFDQTGASPVVCVSWEEAKAYVGWLSQKTGESYRLLTEAEWEYVARGGTQTSRHWGDEGVEQCKYSNGADTSFEEKSGRKWGVASCRDGHVYTAPVGSFRPNKFGLYDFLGNVWEWVEDCWHGDYRDGPEDGSAWTSGGDCDHRVLRGGSWSDSPRNLRSASRDARLAVSRYSSVFGRSGVVGFRVVRPLTP